MKLVLEKYDDIFTTLIERIQNMYNPKSMQSAINILEGNSEVNKFTFNLK